MAEMVATAPVQDADFAAALEQIKALLQGGQGDVTTEDVMAPPPMRERAPVRTLGGERPAQPRQLPAGIEFDGGLINRLARPSPGGDDLDVGHIMRREQVINRFGADPDSPDFQSQAFGNFTSQALPQIAYGALPVAGNALGRLMQVAPRAATGLAAATGTILAPSQAGTQENPAVRDLQIRLRDAGHYRGPIDGRMGSETQRANQTFQEAQQAQERQRIERTRVEADRDAAGAAKAETERLRLEGERLAQRRTEGDERLRDIESNVPWYSRALRDYGPNLGMAAGLGAGMMLRGGVVRASNARSAASAERANRLAGPPESGEADLASRVARVNQFWGEGQRGASPAGPFVSAPGTSRGFRANPDAPPSTSLYQPNPTPGRLTDAGMVGFLETEGALSGYFANQQRGEVTAAQEAVNADPSEVNIQRLQSALNRAAAFDTAANVGRVGGLSYAGSGLKFQRNPTRPDVAAAEAERLRIDQMLGPRRSAPSAPPSPPPPVAPPPAQTAAPNALAGARQSDAPDLPDGYRAIPNGRGWRVQGPDGRFTTMPQSRPPQQRQDSGYDPEDPSRLTRGQ